ncbi:hypothetical protein F0562_010962 [Nyssa sinensis]|uniref:Peptidase A1 domain-containing protein n=1 Tax=Nyssa sinensis TaxID=561372 RepID=A0A5J5A2K6_9ASTE|nr:hypothetical protein F0562_010962 [Nyssa sinensis]
MLVDSPQQPTSSSRKRSMDGPSSSRPRKESKSSSMEKAFEAWTEFSIARTKKLEGEGRLDTSMDVFPILDPCYNVSGVKKLELPTFGIVLSDGAVWNFPVENYFIRLEPDLPEVVCLAILGTPPSALSIIGNYQQQNFHILYDTKKSRLGFAPTNCADV